MAGRWVKRQILEDHVWDLSGQTCKFHSLFLLHSFGEKSVTCLHWIRRDSGKCILATSKVGKGMVFDEHVELPVSQIIQMWGALLRWLCSVHAKRRLPRTKVLGASVFKKWKEEERQSKETENKESDCRKFKGMKCHKSKGRLCQETDLSKKISVETKMWVPRVKCGK